MTTTVLIAGATGVLGSAAAKEARARGLRVIGVSRKSGTPAHAPADEWRTADLNRPHPDLCRGADIVISCVGASLSMDPRAGHAGYMPTDLFTNKHLLDAAAAAGVRRFIYASVLDAPAGATAYHRAHGAVEELLRLRGMPHAILRPTGLFPSFRIYARLSRLGLAMTLGDGSARSNPVHQDDVARLMLDHTVGPDRALDIGGPEVLSRLEILRRIASARGGLQPRRIPAWPARTAAAALRPVHPRFAQLAEFAAWAMTHDCIGPALGIAALGDYFKSDDSRAAPFTPARKSTSPPRRPPAP